MQSLSIFFTLTKRNIKLFFQDKTAFLTSLISPLILLGMYGLFLGKLYEQRFLTSVPLGFELSSSLVSSLVATQLLSSILAVSCVTIAFSSNLLMVQDKTMGRIKDFRISPVRSALLSLSYFLATFISTLFICCIATALCLGWTALQGWTLPINDMLMIFFDTLLLVFFSTALSSIVNVFLSTEGQIIAVNTIIGAGYGFLCGAYLPISELGEGIQKVLLTLPGTYGTALLRNHAMQSVFVKLHDQGLPEQAIVSLKDAFDLNLYVGGQHIAIPTMYLILGGATIALLLIYVLITKFREARA